MVDEGAGSGGRRQPSTSDTGTAELDVLAESLSALARDLERTDDADAMLTAVVAAAVAMIPGAEDGSISTVAARRRITSSAHTGDLPVQVDAIQEDVRQGPCLDAINQQQTVRVADLATETRWPLFAQRASHTGARSMLSLQLFVDGDNLGALNLFARTPDAFTDESERIGLLVATHAAIAYAGVRKATQLGQAVMSRDLIGQAKGILIERHQINGEQAFQMLTRTSQNSNRKLNDIAAELAHGTSPEPGTRYDGDALPGDRATI